MRVYAPDLASNLEIHRLGLFGSTLILLRQKFIILSSNTTANMKRKLNEHDVPEEVTETSHEDANTVTTTTATADFASLGLDPRLLQAVTKEKFSAPTPVQAQAIPLALAGRDILGMPDQSSTVQY